MRSVARSAVVLSVSAALGIGLCACGMGSGTAPTTTKAAATRPRTTAPTTTTVPDTTTTTVPDTTTTTVRDTTTTLPSNPAGALPQTTALPTSSSSQFESEMRDLWSAVKSGSFVQAMPAFFPEAAYAQLKALADPTSDWRWRLVADFELDVAAAHDYLGSAAATADFVGVYVAADEAAWITPGYCYNSIGYWHAPAARLVYTVSGVEQSIGIASLISWRGEWYVVHLGAVLRSSDTGMVDDPEEGEGTFAPAGGC